MINFPDAPVLHQVFYAIGKNWSWDGAKWIVGFPGASGGDVLPVSGSTVLPASYSGYVYVENTTAAPITITLPSGPAGVVLIKDVVGNATAFPITIVGAGISIEGQPSLIISYNYGWVELFYTGVQWVQQ